MVFLGKLCPWQPYRVFWHICFSFSFLEPAIRNPLAVSSLSSSSSLLITYIAKSFGPGQVGFVVDKVALGQVFFQYFGFPCQVSFHQIRHHHNHPGQVQ
jgi:hypothetical protein